MLIIDGVPGHDNLKEDFINMCKGYFRELIQSIDELRQREDRRIKLIADYERNRQKREEIRLYDEKRYQETVIDIMKSIFHLLKSEINQR